MADNSHLESDQINALAIILTALGKVHKDRRLDTLAAACRLYLDAVRGDADRSSLCRLAKATDLTDS